MRSFEVIPDTFFSRSNIFKGKFVSPSTFSNCFFRRLIFILVKKFTFLTGSNDLAQTGIKSYFFQKRKQGLLVLKSANLAQQDSKG